MAKWEYNTSEWTANGDWDALRAGLNIEGDAGWELVAMPEVGSETGKYRLVFKREVDTSREPTPY